jgi:hypothetical protein
MTFGVRRLIVAFLFSFKALIIGMNFHAVTPGRRPARNHVWQNHAWQNHVGLDDPAVALIRRLLQFIGPFGFRPFCGGLQGRPQRIQGDNE